MKINIYIVLSCLICFASCKQSNHESVKFYEAYYPIQVGAWIEYEAKEVVHVNGLGTDTSQYILKEMIAEEFIDNEGRTIYRVERFKKDSITGVYILTDVWYSNKTSSSAERVEENQRFTKMVFPISYSKTWDGNLYNNLDEWEYWYDSLHAPKSYNGLNFDSTVTVRQIDNINPFQNQVAYEVYANHIGLVKKSYVNIDNEDGSELELTIINYGF